MDHLRTTSGATYRILRYDPGCKPKVIYEGRTDVTDEFLLSRRDTDLGLDIWSELAFWPKRKEQPRFTMEARERDGEWYPLGVFDNETLRCPQPN